jgi:hypothetical protein
VAAIKQEQPLALAPAHGEGTSSGDGDGNDGRSGGGAWGASQSLQAHRADHKQVIAGFRYMYSACVGVHCILSDVGEKHVDRSGTCGGAARGGVHDTHIRHQR